MHDPSSGLPGHAATDLEAFTERADILHGELCRSLFYVLLPGKPTTHSSSHASRFVLLSFILPLDPTENQLQSYHLPVYFSMLMAA
jgi:hypothetical protein